MTSLSDPRVCTFCKTEVWHVGHVCKPVPPLAGHIAVAFTVPGTPIPKARPRVTRKGGTYTPQTTVDYENAIARAAQEAMVGKQVIDQPVGVAVLFERSDRKPCDLDNLVKAVLDGMSSTRASKHHMGRIGPVLRNDSLVIEIRARIVRSADRDLTSVTVLNPEEI